VLLGKADRVGESVWMSGLGAWWKLETIVWEYDKEADVLYLSIGEPRPAVGLDIGEGLILRYNERN